MNIVIDARNAATVTLPVETSLQQVYTQWAIRFPEIKFTWLLHKVDEVPALPNIQSLVVEEINTEWRKLLNWYQKQLPLRLNGIRPDLLVPLPGFMVPQLDIPQFMWLLHVPGKHFLERSFFSRMAYRKNLPAMLQSAHTGWVNDAGWNWLQRFAASTDLSKWKAIQPVAVNSISFQHHDAGFYDIDYLTGGRPFFASYIAGKNPEASIQLMKAFSLFKKRQQSDWKLVLLGEKRKDYSELKRSIESYKYKTDIVLLEGTESERSAALNQAYALVQGPDQELPINWLLAALEEGCPLLFAEKKPAQDWLYDVPHYAAASDISDTAASMMLLYKEEEMRRQLRDRSLHKFRQLTLENMAHSLLSFRL